LYTGSLVLHSRLGGSAPGRWAERRMIMMAPNNSYKKAINSSMDEKPTEELLNIWIDNNRKIWSKVAFESIKEILISREIELPKQNSLINMGKINGNTTNLIYEGNILNKLLELFETEERFEILASTINEDNHSAVFVVLCARTFTIGHYYVPVYISIKYINGATSIEIIYLNTSRTFYNINLVKYFDSKIETEIKDYIENKLK
jgi:hypothetical protein